MFLSIISWRVGFPASSAKAGRSRGSLTPVEAGRAPASKRACLLAFSAALGTALVTALFLVLSTSQCRMVASRNLSTDAGTSSYST